MPEPGRIARSLGTAEGTTWLRWLPGLRILRAYEGAWLRHDTLAGLALTTMLVPVGIAYAVASGVPGIYGLYATIVPLLACALFGPSRILVLGPDSSLAAVILAVVLPLSGGDPAATRSARPRTPIPHPTSSPIRPRLTDWPLPDLFGPVESPMRKSTITGVARISARAVHAQREACGANSQRTQPKRDRQVAIGLCEM